MEEEGEERRGSRGRREEGEEGGGVEGKEGGGERRREEGEVKGGRNEGEISNNVPSKIKRQEWERGGGGCESGGRYVPSI